MSEDILQVDYDAIEEIANIFMVQSDLVDQMINNLLAPFYDLQNGGWEGVGATSFFNEFETEILPALKRLTNALESGSDATIRISDILQIAEEEAAAQFDFYAEANYGTRLGFQGGFPGMFAPPPFATGAGVGFGFSPNTSGPGGLSPWATAPFAGIAATLGPGAVPAGRVGGNNLWLYMGGHSDTIFSVHGRAPGVGGWWRAPRFDNQLSRPFIRFDYGPMGNRTFGISPNGGQIPISQHQNYFHFNQRGGHSTFGVRNHQLVTGNPNPRANVLGRVGGSTIVRGASRGLFVLGAGMDIYSVATAENKVEEGVRRGAAWGGAWAGAKGGAAVGATIGTFIAPGVGTAVGGAVGGVVGGIGGYVAGYEIGDEIYEYGGRAIGAVQDFGGGIIDGAGGLIEDAGGLIGAGLGKLGF